MKYQLKNIIQRTPLYSPLRTFMDKRKYSDWVDRGRPAPPPHYVKQLKIKEVAKKYNAQIFVETGTYQGDMIYRDERRFQASVFN